MQPDSTVVQVQFIGAYRRLDFGLGSALDFLRALGRYPSETAVDLAILAGLINAADTRISRAANAQNGWSREIDLVIPVSDPALWAVQGELLSATLKFLTGDFWRVTFRDRPAGFEAIAEPPKTLPLDSYDAVALFSGGLDSLIGAIDLLTAGKRPMLVSHWWDAETSKAQRALLHKFETRFPTNSPRSLRVRLGFDKHEVRTDEIENSQRGRSFLFFSLAAMTAVSLSTPHVIVPENGLIGLNVPLDPLRLGALSTRTTHPHYMANFNRLLGGLGLPVQLENPYRHMTKGEMVKRCKDRQFLQALVPLSMSCSSPAKARYRGLSPRHCGTCVPCLIRRASLKAGFAANDPTLYLVPDLTARTLNTARAEGEHVRSFQFMAAQLNANPSWAASLARTPGPLNDAPTEVDDYVDVLRRGFYEMDALLRNVQAAPR
jgi:7-cyano-7-deazaguanine synthase in queuosine biosynthesis